MCLFNFWTFCPHCERVLQTDWFFARHTHTQQRSDSIRRMNSFFFFFFFCCYTCSRESWLLLCSIDKTFGHFGGCVFSPSVPNRGWAQCATYGICRSTSSSSSSHPLFFTVCSISSIYRYSFSNGSVHRTRFASPSAKPVSEHEHISHMCPTQYPFGLALCRWRRYENKFKK